MVDLAGALLNNPGDSGLLQPWVGKNGREFPSWAALEAADPAIILGPFPADPGSGNGVFVSAALIGAPVTGEWYLVNVSAIGAVYNGGVRDWAKVVAFDIGTGRVNLSKNLEMSSQDAILVYMTAGALLFPHPENVAPIGPSDINLGGNILDGGIILSDAVLLGRIAFGKVNNHISLRGGNTYIFEELEPFQSDIGESSIEGDVNPVGHITATNCTFSGFTLRWQDASFDISNCKNLSEWVFCTRDGANPPTLTNFRVTFNGGEISGTIFDFVNTPFTAAGTFFDLVLNAAIRPWYNRGNGSFSVCRFREASTGDFNPTARGQVIINGSVYGDIFNTSGADPTHQPGFSYFEFVDSFSGIVTINGQFLNFWQANVPGFSSSVIRCSGTGDMSGVISLASGSFGIDGGSSSVVSMVDTSTDHSGLIDITASICLRGGTLTPSIDALMAYLVVRTPLGITAGGTINFGGAMTFNGGALSSFISLGAGASTGLVIGVTGNTFAENMSLNVAVFLVDSTFAVGVSINVSGFTAIDLSGYNPVIATQFIAQNQGQGTMTITGEIDVTNFSSGDAGAFISSVAGGAAGTRMSGTLTLKDVHLTGATFDWVQETSGTDTVELTGSVALCNFRASGGGTMTILNIAGGGTGIGPAVVRIDFGTMLYFLVLTSGAGVFAWAGSVWRIRHVYIDFLFQVNGAIMAAFEMYKCHDSSGQSTAPGSLAYKVTGGGDPALFVFWDCKFLADFPAGSKPQDIQDWTSITTAAAIPVGQTVGINGVGLAIPNPPFPGSKLVGPNHNGPAAAGHSAVIVTKGRVKVAVGANVIVPGIPLVQSVVAGICHNGVVGASPDNTVGVPLTANVGGFAYTAVGCAG